MPDHKSILLAMILILIYLFQSRHQILPVRNRLNTMDSFHSLLQTRLLLSNDNSHNQRITKSSNDSFMNDDDDDGCDDGSGDYGIGGSIDNIGSCGSCNGNSRCHKFTFATPSKTIRTKCSKTIFWQFLVTVIYTLLYFSTSTCLAARQEGMLIVFFFQLFHRF